METTRTHFRRKNIYDDSCHNDMGILQICQSNMDFYRNVCFRLSVLHRCRSVLLRRRYGSENYSSQTCIYAKSQQRFYHRQSNRQQKYDCFGHAQFAESMANKLLDTNISSGAFTLGIVAPWGFGKTSFINMMKNRWKTKL